MPINNSESQVYAYIENKENENNNNAAAINPDLTTALFGT